ncbi:YggT family protein [Rhizomicrobium palustre]|uniref:YggT family protein n=1 Tax=Rhizomicrobium palustre TaxID=189966 RepID=A0A846MZ64_9PROT|nr:YggT family protein [Rhizomicrobium palustre]NIK88227.1 YggT family protein [Rhizomicrobium palustre]
MYGPLNNPFVWLIVTLLDLYSWVVLAAVIMSWLLAFNVVNYHNNIVRSIMRFLDILTEPVFRAVRKVIPTMGGLDLSPIVVFLGIVFLQKLVIWLAFHFLAY